VKVAVVGVGAAGLAATQSPRKAGVDVTAFESGDAAGGWARCYSKGGDLGYREVAARKEADHGRSNR